MICDLQNLKIEAFRKNQMGSSAKASKEIYAYRKISLLYNICKLLILQLQLLPNGLKEL